MSILPIDSHLSPSKENQGKKDIHKSVSQKPTTEGNTEYTE